MFIYVAQAPFIEKSKMSDISVLRGLHWYSHSTVLYFCVFHFMYTQLCLTCFNLWSFSFCFHILHSPLGNVVFVATETKFEPVPWGDSRDSRKGQVYWFISDRCIHPENCRLIFAHRDPSCLSQLYMDRHRGTQEMSGPQTQEYFF